MVLLAAAAGRAHAQSTSIAGGLDVRAGGQTTPEERPVTGLSALFVNLRNVQADEKGDRFILVVQVDVEEELSETHLYNTYGQYKGPLGRWNVRVGRYLVPFGLLAYHDTERFLLPAHEVEALALRLDEGIQLHGFAGSFDYAVSLSRGFRNRATPIARLGWQGEEAKVGLSYLLGRLPSFADETALIEDELLPGARIVEKHRVALDAELPIGPLVLRAEPLAGTDDAREVWGGFLEASVALSPRWEASANGAYLDSRLSGERWHGGAAVAFRILPTVFLRGGYVQRSDFGATRDLWVLQLYAEFAQVLGP